MFSFLFVKRVFFLYVKYVLNMCLTLYNGYIFHIEYSLKFFNFFDKMLQYFRSNRYFWRTLIRRFGHTVYFLLNSLPDQTTLFKCFIIISSSKTPWISICQARQIGVLSIAIVYSSKSSQHNTCIHTVTYHNTSIQLSHWLQASNTLQLMSHARHNILSPTSLAYETEARFINNTQTD